MKRKGTRSLLVILLTFTLLQLSTFSQDNKNSSSVQNQAKPAAASADAKADVQKAVSTNGQDRVVLDTNLVNVTVSVTDAYGRFVTGFGKEHFEVFDEKVKQEVGL